MTRLSRVAPDVDRARPAPARIYDYLLTGTSNFQCDRDAAERIMTVVPEIKDCAWSNRGFHQRAARWIAEHGVRQFIDIGSGLPTMENTHDIVQRVDPRCRVVYVDNDPTVKVEAAAMLANNDNVVTVLGDLREPQRLLGDAELRQLIDFSRPVGLMMTAVLHFVSDASDPRRLVGELTSAMAPGSYLAVSHLTDDFKPKGAVAEFCGVFENATEQLRFRSRDQVERFFDGLELVPPTELENQGRLCYTGDWGAEDPMMADSDGSRWLYAGVARRL